MVKYYGRIGIPIKYNNGHFYFSMKHFKGYSLLTPETLITVSELGENELK